MSLIIAVFVVGLMSIGLRKTIFSRYIKGAQTQLITYNRSALVATPKKGQKI